MSKSTNEIIIELREIIDGKDTHIQAQIIVIEQLKLKCDVNAKAGIAVGVVATLVGLVIGWNFR